ASFQKPEWDGTPLDGKTILLHAEQGLGDTIQFARYLPLVKERGGTVLLDCPAAMARLCAGVGGVDQVSTGGSPPVAFDVQAHLLSLPRILGTTLATIPAPVPYMRADPVLLERWRRELQPLHGFKVGIAWQGNPDNVN